MLTVSRGVDDASTPCSVDDAEAVGDPDCGFALTAPGLHVCTDRDGAVVTGDKACFPWARHQLRAARRCTECDNGTAVAGEVLDGVYFPPERCSNCNGSGVTLPSADDYAVDDEADWPVAS